MYYLKCNNCGHQNEVKSATITLCSGCEKPLDNSFYEWIKLNHEKTFEDYKKEVCTYQEDPKITAPKSSREDWKRALKIIAPLISLFAVILISNHFGNFFERWSSSEKTSKDVLTQPWVKNTYTDFGLTIETPGKMIQDTLPIPDKVKNLIEKTESYKYHRADGFLIEVAWMKGKVTTKFNLEGAASGSLNGMRLASGVSDFNYTEYHLIKDSIPGIVQKGTYKRSGYDLEFIDSWYCKGLSAWQIMILYQGNDDVARIAAKRVMQSIEIKNQSTQ